MTYHTYGGSHALCLQPVKDHAERWSTEIRKSSFISVQMLQEHMLCFPNLTCS